MSSVVVVDLKKPDFDLKALDRAFQLASVALTRPRKMLSNALPSEIDNSTIESAGLEPTDRPGTVDLEGWLELANRSSREA
jgi:16S rRNA A1518/A1519 N6-dimethyltransferase RsmA/KsgA/DIM1 with predicted DNA glycosylase/AP lyase activity